MTSEAALHDILQLIMFLTSLLANIWLASIWRKARDARDDNYRLLMTVTREGNRLAETNDELRESIKRKRRLIAITMKHNQRLRRDR